MARWKAVLTSDELVDVGQFLKRFEEPTEVTARHSHGGSFGRVLVKLDASLEGCHPTLFCVLLALTLARPNSDR